MRVNQSKKAKDAFVVTTADADSDSDTDVVMPENLLNKTTFLTLEVLT